MKFISKIFVFLIGLVSLVNSDTECPYVTTISDTRVDKQKFRLVQYNVEWLFIDYYSTADCPGSGCPWINGTEANEHLSTVSNVIKNLQPDIINLCEIEGCDEINMLASNIKSDEYNYRGYLKKGTDSSTGQNVGMLTLIDPLINLYRTESRENYPIVGSTCGYTGSIGSTGVSKHYITEIEINKVPIALIGAHLLAYPTDVSRCAQREAQTQVLQNVIMEYVNKNYEIIIMGDFNDFDSEVIDANNNIPISKSLDILKGYYGKYAGKYELISAGSLIPKEDRYSDWWDQNNNCVSSSSEFSMIDHILVSKFLYDNIVDAFVFNDYDEYCHTYNSDHYPLVVDFVL